MDHVLYQNKLFPSNLHNETRSNDTTIAHHLSNPSLHPMQGKLHFNAEVNPAVNLLRKGTVTAGHSQANDSIRKSYQLNQSNFNTSDNIARKLGSPQSNYPTNYLTRQQSYAGRDSHYGGGPDENSMNDTLLKNVIDQQLSASSCSLHELSVQDQARGLPRELNYRQEEQRHSRTPREDICNRVDLMAEYKTQQSLQNDKWCKSTIPVSHYATLGRKPILKSSITSSISVKSGVGDFLSSKNQESAV